MSSGDGHTDLVPALSESRPVASRSDASRGEGEGPGQGPERRGAVEIDDAGLAVLGALLAESRKQTEILEETRALAEANRQLLHRIVLGDVDLLDSDDIQLALGIGRTKLAELVADGEIPHTRIGTSPRGPLRTTRDALRAVIRSWMG